MVLVEKLDSPVEYIPKSSPNWLFKGQLSFDLLLLNYFYENNVALRYVVVSFIKIYMKILWMFYVLVLYK